MGTKGLLRPGHLLCWQNPLACAPSLPGTGLAEEWSLWPNGGECFLWPLIIMGFSTDSLLVGARLSWWCGSPGEKRTYLGPFLLLGGRLKGTKFWSPSVGWERTEVTLPLCGSFSRGAQNQFIFLPLLDILRLPPTLLWFIVVFSRK